MNILVLNSGSSSLKFQLIDAKSKQVLEKGHVDGIGLTSCKFILNGEESKQKVKDHTEAIKLVLSKIDITKINALGHRVVHGGEFYSKATKITTQVQKKIKDLCELAPLHNPPNLAGIEACKKAMPKIPQVAVFDTAFHQTIPEHAFMYGIPYEFYKKYKIRKYGFHGTSHKYITQECTKLFGTKNINLITCHLGNGSSITAIRNGQSIDTTMGFTPLQGLIMGTRSGDIDAEIVEYLSEKEKMKTSEVLTLLNKKSGLFGICGDSDVRIIHEKALKGSKKHKLALDMLAYKIAQYIGSYNTVLGNADAIVFTAGIGEGAWYLREKVCKYLEGLGVAIDKRKNKKHELEISTPKSTINVLIVPTNEELMIAKETYQLLK